MEVKLVLVYKNFNVQTISFKKAMQQLPFYLTIDSKFAQVSHQQYPSLCTQASPPPAAPVQPAAGLRTKIAHLRRKGRWDKCIYFLTDYFNIHLREFKYLK